MSGGLLNQHLLRLGGLLGAGRPGLGRPACPCHHVAPPFRGTVLISSRSRFFRRFDQPMFFWAGGPPWCRAAYL